jgi:hypothetical protein
MQHTPVSSPALFPLGQVVATTWALELLEENNLSLNTFIERHEQGDWGNLGAEDKQSNNDALKYGDRIFSSYKIHDKKLWIITEWDRSVTTLLLPDEY